jgi:hypothetical protein
VVFARWPDATRYSFRRIEGHKLGTQSLPTAELDIQSGHCLGLLAIRLERFQDVDELTIINTTREHNATNGVRKPAQIIIWKRAIMHVNAKHSDHP